MKTPLTIAPILVFIVLIAYGTTAYCETYVIHGGTVHTLGPLGAIEGGTIVVEDGVVVSVGNDLEIPQHAKVFDASNRVVTPGLMNSFTHLGIEEVSTVAGTVDHAATHSKDSSALAMHWSINPNSALIRFARSDGLTRAVVAPSAGPNIFSGTGAIIDLSTGNDFLTKRFAAVFATLGEAGSRQSGGSRSAAWLQLTESIEAARAFSDSRSKFEKQSRFSPLLSRADLEALERVVRRDVPMVVAVDRQSDIERVIDYKRSSKLNIVIKGGREAWRVADKLAAAEIPVLVNPMLNLPDNFEALGSTLENARILHAKGVVVAFSGSSSLYEWPYNAGGIGKIAGLAVAYGLPWEAALEAVTIAPARVWGIDDRYGSIEPGKEADLVIWDGDPLEAISGPVAVFIRGEPVSMRSRQSQLRDKYMNRVINQE